MCVITLITCKKTDTIRVRVFILGTLTKVRKNVILQKKAEGMSRSKVNRELRGSFRHETQ